MHNETVTPIHNNYKENFYAGVAYFVYLW